jgi:hypothetical protein
MPPSWLNYLVKQKALEESQKKHLLTTAAGTTHPILCCISIGIPRTKHSNHAQNQKSWVPIVLGYFLEPSFHQDRIKNPSDTYSCTLHDKSKQIILLRM